MIAQEIARALRGKKLGAQWQCKCPAHHDKTASMTVRDGRNGNLLFYCHAGCSFNEIRDALKGLGLLKENPRMRRQGLFQWWEFAKHLYEDGAPISCIEHMTGLWASDVSERAARFDWKYFKSWSEFERDAVALAVGGDWNDRVPIDLRKEDYSRYET